MPTPYEYVAESYRRWIEYIAAWDASRDPLLQTWCAECVASDLKADVPGMEHLPHSLAHVLVLDLEDAYSRAREKVVARLDEELTAAWRTRTDPDLMEDGLRGLSNDFILDLGNEFTARLRIQKLELEAWEESIREKIHDSLRAVASERTGLVLDLVPVAVQIAVQQEIEVTTISSLIGWGGMETGEVAKMRAGLDQMLDEWIARLPDAELSGSAAVPQGMVCELCKRREAWVAGLDAPHSVLHPLVTALHGILSTLVESADWDLREQPFDIVDGVALYERAFLLVLNGRRASIERALAVHVNERLDSEIHAASEALLTQPEGER